MGDGRSYQDACGVARALDVVGERWALLVVRDLLLGPKRFNDLLNGLRAVSPNVLSQRLRDLIGHGVVLQRTLEAPVRVRMYELTDWGRALEPILQQLGQWGNGAPVPPGSVLGIDSILLSVKACFDPTRAAVWRGVYELRIDGDTYVVDVGETSVRVTRGSARQRPDASITTDLGTLQAVCGHRTTIEESARTGTLHLQGDEDAGRRLAAVLLAPFPVPNPELT